MPRYFFHIVDGHPIEDMQGIELGGLDAVHQEAARLASELMRENAAVFWSGEPWLISVEDESGREVAALHLVASRPGVAIDPLTVADD